MERHATELKRFGIVEAVLVGSVLFGEPPQAESQPVHQIGIEARVAPMHLEACPAYRDRLNCICQEEMHRSSYGQGWTEDRLIAGNEKRIGWNRLRAMWNRA
ncbi:MAG: hypothetical protein Q6373_022485 [Candidatus Sigynarchaeota archaeon]